MKTRIKFLSLLSLASAVVFSLGSCSNNDDPGADTGDSKSVFLKLSSEPGTYAEGLAVANATPVTFTSGHLYFTTTSGDIRAYYTVTTAVSGANNINLAGLRGAGETISNLPSDVRVVHVIGNTLTAPTTGNISAFKTSLLSVESQDNLSGANLYGTNTLSLVSANQYECIVPIAPTVARIELTNMTASGNITAFNVNGIFIDRYYAQAAVDGTVVSGDFVSNGTNATLFTGNSSAYPASLNPAIYDWYTAPLSDVSLVVGTPTSGQVWGYNVFANAAGIDVPRIIIRLSDIKINGATSPTYPDPQFLTVRALLDNGSPLLSIKGGEVYNIAAGAFIFTEDNLNPLPNMDDINVTVSVTLLPWTVVPVTPEL